METIVTSLRYYLDENGSEVVDVTVQIVGKAAAQGPGGASVFTMYQIPSGLVAGMAVGQHRILVLMPA